MKLNKTFGRIATTLVATAMLASVAVVPASAEDASIGTNGVGTADGITSITFTKALLLPENVPMPSKQMSFQLQGTNGGETITDQSGNVVQTENGTGTYSTTIDFNATSAEKDESYTVDGIDRYTMDVTIDLTADDEQLSFEEPGVYAYLLEETTTAPNDDWTMASDVYVYLYATRAQNADNVVITGVSFSTVDGNVTPSTVKTNAMTNYYQVTPGEGGSDPSVKDNELTVAKKVDGTMGDRSQRFTFTISIDPVTDGKQFTAIYETSSDGQNYGVDSDTDKAAVSFTDTDDDGVYTATVQLANNERIHIYGLSTNDMYTVDEADYTSEGYENPEVTGGTDGVVATFAQDVDIVYTNTREAVSPTGLIMDIAPYVLLVVVAAAGCFVFLRKRRED